MTIYFDMDGTIANLYGVPNWLEKLDKNDPSPYELAQPLLDMHQLTKVCKGLQEKGIKIGIISWLSRSATTEYKKAIRQAKKEWLKKHFDITLDEIRIVQYGTNKRTVAGKQGDILIDDEIKNIRNWEGKKNDRQGIFCQNNPEIIFQTLFPLLKQ